MCSVSIDPTGSWALGIIALAVAWYHVAKLKYGKRE